MTLLACTISFALGFCLAAYGVLAQRDRRTIDDKIDEWRAADGLGVSLRDYLGMTEDEYNAFLHGDPLWKERLAMTECENGAGIGAPVIDERDMEESILRILQPPGDGYKALHFPDPYFLETEHKSPPKPDTYWRHVVIEHDGKI